MKTLFQGMIEGIITNLGPEQALVVLKDTFERGLDTYGPEQQNLLVNAIDKVSEQIREKASAGQGAT